MKSIRRVFILFSMFSALSAHAQSFAEDLKWFKNSLTQSRFLSQDLDQYFLMTDSSRQSFTLPERRAPWAGNYFPMAIGGIANRWQKKEFFLEVKHKNIINLDGDQKNQLSPIEKYDLWMGDKKMSATNHELQRRGPLREAPPEYWEGFCNGVRCAGILMPEPKFAVEVSLKDGSKINFEPADLKALAGATYFYVDKYSQIGAPTQKGLAQNRPNAAVFDLALRYYLGKKKKAFVIDSSLNSEIWNESVVGFDRSTSEPLNLTTNEQAYYRNAVKKVHVQTSLVVLGEVDIFESNALTKKSVAKRESTQTMNIDYYLYYDDQDRMVDGSWPKATGKSGVDFVWFAAGKGTDQEYIESTGNPFLSFAKVKALFKESVHPSCTKIFL